MNKRSSTSTLIPTSSPPKRVKTLRKADLRQDSAPQWLHDAAAQFVNNTPGLKWTGGFYSWGTWLDDLRQLPLWTNSITGHNPPPVAWRALVQACKASGQVRGTAALYRAKSDLVAIIINIVFRKGETQRITHKGETQAAERDVMRRVRAVVTRQRRHEAVALTLIRFLDLAFVLSAYKDCRMAGAGRLGASVAEVNCQVESELLFLDLKPNAKQIKGVTKRMEQHMWENRWLPWYEQVPGVRDEMVIRARDAARSFCVGLPFPQVRVGTGVRGLSRDHLAGAGSMDPWLLSLLAANLNARWADLAAVYERDVESENGEEDPLLKETSRRVLQTMLEPLTEVREELDATHSKLVDAAPGIIVTQSVRSAGRFTFRQLLELYIHLSMFGRFLHDHIHHRALPSIDKIHLGVVKFEEIRRRLLDVRSVIDLEHLDAFTNWCLSTQEYHHRQSHFLPVCIEYQKGAIRAALGSAVLRFASNPGAPFVEFNENDSDPLTYAAIVAEWDPRLAARIVDAAVRIGESIRKKFSESNSFGMDLYTYRRILVCGAARDRLNKDNQAAARLMRRLYPIWDVVERDKAVGKFNENGLVTIRHETEKGNFEAIAVYGALHCSLEWQAQREACGLKLDVEAGVLLICKAVSACDAAAAIDLVHLLISNPKKEGGKTWEIPPRLVDYSVQTLKDAAREEPSIRLFLGYLFSVGAKGVPIDIKAAVVAYQCVLESVSSGPRYQAYAANNLGVLRIMNASGLAGSLIDTAKALEYVRVAAAASDTKAESNLGALLCLESLTSLEKLDQARRLYWRCLESREPNTPLTVVQVDRKSMNVTMYEVVVEEQHRRSFCEDLSAEGMELERYGRVLAAEQQPYVP